MNPRIIRTSKVCGSFGLPIGIKFLDRTNGPTKKVVVSTVCLEDAHLEDPLRICSPERGYETMIFLDGCTFFSVFTAKYKTLQAAINGHRAIVHKILKGTLPLVIQLYYSAWQEIKSGQAKNSLPAGGKNA